MALQPIRAAHSSARISDLIWLLPRRHFASTGSVTAIRVRTYSVALTSTAKSARQASTLAGTRRIGCASPCLRRRAWTGRVAGGRRSDRPSRQYRPAFSAHHGANERSDYMPNWDSRNRSAMNSAEIAAAYLDDREDELLDVVVPPQPWSARPSRSSAANCSIFSTAMSSYAQMSRYST